MQSDPVASSGDRPLRDRIRIVCATRVTREDFHAKTALGRSLFAFREPAIELVLFPENTSGLSALYNMALRAAASSPAVLVFVHDDVHLCDFYWPYHVLNGLETFDVIGIAGSTRRVAGQPMWCGDDSSILIDDGAMLSGVMAHGTSFPPESLNFFGPAREPVKLLDGLFLAVRSETLLSRQIEFDERFDFHFYDLDFCRQVESKGLQMGTWTISVIHESTGNFQTPAWRSAYQAYIQKWKE